MTLNSVVCVTIQNKFPYAHKRKDPYPTHYHFVRLYKISCHDIISTTISVVQQSSFLLWCTAYPMIE
jgi:hypothetical protein